LYCGLLLRGLETGFGATLVDLWFRCALVEERLRSLIGAAFVSEDN
jgi:hypothetical protein